MSMYNHSFCLPISEDSEGGRRKLFLLHTGLSSDVESSLSKLLDTLSIDHSQHPCRLNPPDNVSAVSGELAIDVLTTQDLARLRSPGRIRLQLGYENLSFEEALKAVLPDSVSPISGFTLMGHLAHFNLKDDALPYRHIIGQLAIDKIANVRTVVHKATTIESEYRTFTLDLMAGQPDYVTTLRENGLAFELDFSKVYWNSRLSTEHSRIVNVIKSTKRNSKKEVKGTPKEHPVPTTLFDVFAGIGPFAIPAARSEINVHANDLNPDSFKWLKHNVDKLRSRKYPMNNIQCHNLDGREFIKKIVLPQYWALSKSANARFILVMNLPALALDFFDAFAADSIITPTQTDNPLMPLEVYCYCFLRRNEESETTAKERLARAMGCTVDELFSSSPGTSQQAQITNWNLRFVRNVAPFKDMFCCEFQFHCPVHACRGDRDQDGDSYAESAGKRPKLT